MFCIRRVKFACKAMSASQRANSDCLTDEMPASLTSWDVALTGSSGSVALWSVLVSWHLITNGLRCLGAMGIWTLTPYKYSWERPRVPIPGLISFDTSSQLDISRMLKESP